MLPTVFTEGRTGRVLGILSIFIIITIGGVATLLTRQELLRGTLSAINPLLILGGLVFGFLVLRYYAAAVPLLVALVYMNLSEALVRYHDFPSFLQLLVVVLAFAAWLHKDTAPLGTVATHPLTLTLLALVVHSLATTALATDTRMADGRVVELFRSLVIYGLLTLLIRDRRRLLQALVVLIGSAAFLSVLPIIQTLTGKFDERFGGLARIKDAHIYGDVFEARIAGPIGDPNFFAQILLLVVAIPLLMHVEARSRRDRFLLLGASTLIFAAILLTYSRGAMLALAVIAAFIIRILHISWRTTAVIVAIGIASLIFLPRSVTERFLTIAQVLPAAEAPLHPDSSFRERRLLMQVAWLMFADNPVSGVGAGNYSARYDEYVDLTSSEAREYADASDQHFPHNLYLEIAAETGLIGLVLFAAVVLAAAATLRDARRRFAAAGDRLMMAAAFGMSVGLAGFLVTALFLHLGFPRYLFLFLGLAAAMGRVAPRPPTLTSPMRAKLAAADAGPAVSDSPAVRRPVAVLVSRFPLITETFILREISELERQGQPVVLVSMIEEHPAVMHPEAVPWHGRAIYTPFFSPKIAGAFGRALTQQWRVLLPLIGWLAATSIHRPVTLFKSLLVVPKCAYLASRLRTEGVSHLHAHFATHPTTMALIISKLTGIPFSFTVHAHDIFVDRTHLRRKVQEAAFIRSISRFNKLFLERLYREEAHGKIEVVHVGIELWRYQRSQAPAGGGHPKILTIAALKPYKGLVYLIRAARILAEQGVELDIDIIGAGPLKGQLEREIAHCGVEDRVRLLGALPQEKVAEAIAECTLFVLPSIIASDGQMEGIPVALMEAMAAEKGVVATAISGVPELVEHRTTGLLVDPANPDQLAVAIRELLGDPELRAKLGAAGRSRVEERFSLPKIVSELSAVLDRHVPHERHYDIGAAAAAAPGSTWGLRRAHRGTDSEVLELIAVTPDGPVELVQKRHLSRPGESRPAAERADQEHAILRELADTLESAAGGRELAVPAPVAHEPGSPLLVTGRADGVPMDLLIGRARKSSKVIPELAGGAAALGTWLRAFQSTRPPRDGCAAVDELVARSFRDLRNAGLSSGGTRRVGRSIESLAATLRAPIAVPHHGDLWPGNVFVTSDRLTVIDFEGFRTGLPSEDLAYFLVHADLYLAWRHPHILGTLQQELFAGYGASVDESELRLAQIACALHLLTRDHREAPLLRRVVQRMILRRELTS
jgi:colanic acid/amylovoran biosynthesis glycosyltransferase